MAGGTGGGGFARVRINPHRASVTSVCFITIERRVRHRRVLRTGCFGSLLPKKAAGQGQDKLQNLLYLFHLVEFLMLFGYQGGNACR